MTTTTSELMLRPDLVQKMVWMGSERVWVVKDPLSRAFSYFSDQEREILVLADGSRSVTEIASECNVRFAPQYLSVESIVRFFADARRKGLLLVDRCGTQHEMRESDVRRSWWKNPLAIRVPGVNPDLILDSMSHHFATLFSPVAFLLAVVLMLIAACGVVVNFGDLTEHLAIAAGRMQSNAGLLILLGVLSITKVVHELAHAIACKRFGGECREIGLMFLVGVPCLYCDVSDAWMLPRRWQRILISAAGMLAELTLASIAALVWLFTVDGPVRDVCATVMVVCSVTTVLFNGNPLLRYDGYYMLSDATGIPNLSAEATGILREWVRRFLWASPGTGGFELSKRNFLVAAYGFMSGFYRIVIFALIMLMIYRFAERYEMSDAVGVLALSALAWLLFKIIRSVLTPPPSRGRQKGFPARRPVLMVGLILGCVAVIGLIPMPRTTTAYMTIQPGDAEAVFVTNGGRLVGAVVNGTDVRAGQTLATLVNESVDIELLQARGHSEQLEVQLDGLKKRRLTSREAGLQIPVVERSLDEAKKEQQLRELLAGQLVLNAPHDGRVFSVGKRAESKADEREPGYWFGTPLDPANVGAWIEEGTKVCLVGDPETREAVLFVPQQDIELIRQGQRVNLLLDDHAQGEVRGRVIELAASPTRDIPDELRRSGRIEVLANDLEFTPFYEVRVLLEPTASPLPVRLTGRASVDVQSASLLHRIARFLRDAFA
ncbi:HlyD family efflux transporter periplasmic adaptor subunit [Rubripirellula sp.]|nr:HlyD family efflux transporter periplasmic adaptor subunit [Rubripirellula sp.]MDB4749715.1 HlyD family efflux transporter periplasmic adaptor subunit [Rubripirellula sp.]